MTASQTHWLIFATLAGPIAGALLATGLIAGVVQLAKTRSEHVEHVEPAGADLYRHGVPLDEA